MKYKVKLEQARVIAWAVVKGGDDGDIDLMPVTIPLDPRKAKTDVYDFVPVAGILSNGEIKAHEVQSLIPAAATSLMSIVLCDGNGRELHRPFGKERVDYPLGFLTSGSGHEDKFEAWRKDAEANPEKYFSWYFDDLEWQRRKKDEEEVEAEA